MLPTKNSKELARLPPIETSAPKKQMVVEEVGPSRAPLVDDECFKQLGPNCQKLVTKLTFFEPEEDCIKVTFNPEVYHHSRVDNVILMFTDIKDLLINDWLDVSIVQMFIS